jgi:GR25 family glycosyltransferase involved in LPS biosynthesis
MEELDEDESLQPYGVAQVKSPYSVLPPRKGQGSARQPVCFEASGCRPLCAPLLLCARKEINVLGVRLWAWQWCSLVLTIMLSSIVAALISQQTVSIATPPQDSRWWERLVCNGTAPLPNVEPVRTWHIDAGWNFMCTASRSSHEYPLVHRNWCWRGLKQECQNNPRAHRSWNAVQKAAFDAGKVPPTKEVPFQPLQNAEVCDRKFFGQAEPWTSADWMKASSWFRSLVQVYVVNLPSDMRRWEAIATRLAQLNIRPVRVAGVDLRDASALKEAKVGGWIPRGFNISHARNMATAMTRGMGNLVGTIGHAAAHLKVLTQILADRPPLAVVLEDDSWLEGDFVVRLWHLVSKELPCDWEVVSLSSRCGYGDCVSQHLSRLQVDGNEPEWQCHQGVNLGLHGMLYRVERLREVQDKWRKVLFDEERPHCLDADVALASLADQVAYYAVPACQAPGFLHEAHLGSTRQLFNEGRNGLPQLRAGQSNLTFG